MSHVIFRVDASNRIGTGHVRRCATLAYQLQNRGCQSLFICRELEGHLGEWIQKQGYEVRLLPRVEGAVNVAGEDDPSHAPWLEAVWEQDAAQTAEIIHGLGTRTDLVVDHYALDERWESTLRPCVERIMVIDDLADRNHECDVLVDHNWVEGYATRYTGKVPEACRQLLGPDYSLIDPLYGELAQGIRRDGRVRRVLVSFGGVDAQRQTRRVVEALLIVNHAAVSVDVVLNEGHLDFEWLREVAQKHSWLKLHPPQDSLAHLMASADLAVGAAGVTSWERLCLKLPSVLITLADNQIPIARLLHREGLGYWLGNRVDFTDERLRKILAEALTGRLFNAPDLPRCAQVDGRGAQRVARVLSKDLTSQVVLREATDEDMGLLYRWANEAETRRQAFHPEPIPWEDHVQWFHRKRAEHGQTHLWMAETEEGQAVGQVRLELLNGEWIISYSVAPEMRGKKIAARMLQEAMHTIQDRQADVRWVGLVKEGNTASIRVFEKLGYEKEWMPEGHWRFFKHAHAPHAEGSKTAEPMHG
ncbi:MAG: UDP-2,4-diacetamido-2,4,6-trideoxy-beta-L-altropyranose hydrolase [Candidatus Methylacidiphilales bacterium]